PRPTSPASWATSTRGRRHPDAPAGDDLGRVVAGATIRPRSSGHRRAPIRAGITAVPSVHGHDAATDRRTGRPAGAPRDGPADQQAGGGDPGHRGTGRPSPDGRRRQGVGRPRPRPLRGAARPPGPATPFLTLEDVLYLAS